MTPSLLSQWENYFILSLPFLFYFFDGVLWMKQCISMPVFLLSLAFLLISNCAPFLILCLHKDKSCTKLSPFCSKIFPQALFLLIPFVAVDLLGHSLSKPFWWAGYHHSEDGDVVGQTSVVSQTHVRLLSWNDPLWKPGRSSECALMWVLSLMSIIPLGWSAWWGKILALEALRGWGLSLASAPSALSDFEKIIMSSFCTWNVGIIVPGNIECNCEV